MSEQASARVSFIFKSAVAFASTFALTACGDAGDPVSSANAGGAAAGAGGSSSGASGSGGASAGSTSVGQALVWDASGFVAADTNPFAIQGPFYFYSDCEPPSGLPCTIPDAALTGADSKPGWSVDTTHVCVKGSAVQVQDKMFAAQWGAGLALDLNSKGGEPGTPAAKGTFDLQRAGVRGFSVDISGAAPARIRINLTMPGVADSSFVDATIPGTTTFNVADPKQGSWVTDEHPLDPTRVEALQFQVFTNAATATPYDFCVDAIRVIADGDPLASSGGSGGGG
jgi:hypothetical protein